jgi:hypothetical protein
MGPLLSSESQEFSRKVKPLVDELKARTHGPKDSLPEFRIL